METPIHFQAGEVVLEGLLHRTAAELGVVIAHPHSLYGGDMYNPVVAALCRAYGSRGFSTLRFNFRGVGGSGGRFEDGIGERADVAAAVRYLADAGISVIHLAGYSFGAWVMATLPALPEVVVSQLYVAPPVNFVDFTGVAAIDRLRMVITGSGDDIAPPQRIKKLLCGWNDKARLVVIEGADHFFAGSLTRLEYVLRESIVQGPDSPGV